ARRATCRRRRDRRPRRPSAARRGTPRELLRSRRTTTKRGEDSICRPRADDADTQLMRVCHAFVHGEADNAWMRKFDMVVIGTGPAGHAAATQAAKLGKAVAIIERKQVGGVCINTGTVPSKTLREAVMHLSGIRHRAHYGESYRTKSDVTVSDLLHRAEA